ncbi:MAG: hypothetical protein A2Z14_06820 [Chloroflexi bacterium RBG_16_48_8]|nr:MAG: hypothetical protein A2Z14_06820 [Chloroflexi bacterium RBG_16_48_8]
MVLAAYIDPNFEQNARLMDAVIFSSGGGHIELGEWDGMLAEPYFPKYQKMSSELAGAMERYYDFTIRYQELIGPMTRDETQKYLGRIEMEGVRTQPHLLMNKVWPIVREGNHFTAISFVNLLGVKSPEWAKEIVNSPKPLGPTTVQIQGAEERAACVWMATPDGEDPSPQFLQYKQDNNDKVLTFQIHSLAYWDLVVIEWSD